MKNKNSKKKQVEAVEDNNTWRDVIPGNQMDKIV